jgi:hypothetical protein
MMRTGVAAALLLLSACGSSKPGGPPPADVAHSTEGLTFPDLVAPGDRGAVDAPPLSDRHTERAPDSAKRDGGKPREATVDRRPPDTWPGGACLYDWSKWSCTSIFPGLCTADCSGGGAAQLVCIGNACTCTKNGVKHTCGAVAGLACTPCQGAFKAGCCSF